MVVNIIEEKDFKLKEDTRIYRKIMEVPKSEKFPLGLKYTFNYLLLIDGEWKNIVRIDNHQHDPKRVGCHIHRYDSDEVEFKDLRLEEIYDLLLKIGNEIKGDEG